MNWIARLFGISQRAAPLAVIYIAVVLTVMVALMVVQYAEHGSL